MHKIKGAAFAALIITGMIFATISAVLPTSSAADSGWTLVKDASTIKAYPDLHEYVWQKNASMTPNGPNDKIGLHRLVKTGTAPKEVIFIMPSAFSSPINSAYGTNAPEENWTKTENQSQAIYWANRGFDVYTMETRDYFVSQNFNLSQYDFNTTQLSFMANWGWDQWISDMKEAVSKTKEVSGVEKVFMVGFSDGGEAVLNYATQNWKQEMRGIVLLDAQIYGGKATQLVAKRGNETNTYNLTRTLSEVNANGTYFKEFGGVAGWIVLAQYAEIHPEAPPINPWTGLWLNSTAKNSFTGKPFANITDWFTSIFSLLGIANVYGGIANLTVTIHNFAAHLRYSPNRLTLESQAMRDWVNCPYLTYDFDDHWNEIGIPTLAFTSGSYTNSTGIFRFVNGINSTDFMGVTLSKYMSLDTFMGINSSLDVNQPTVDWMVNHPVPTPTPIPTPTQPTPTATIPPTTPPTPIPTAHPTQTPAKTPQPTITAPPTANPTATPALAPTIQPTQPPTATPTQTPSPEPTQSPQNNGSAFPEEVFYAIVAVVAIIVMLGIALVLKKRIK
jgi:pimeloyl-ACP methyl ester carboxylesterase